MNYVPVGCIVTICVCIGKLLKESKINSKWIPIIMGISGGVLGIVSMYVVPNFPANNLIEALTYGLVSGLASTGLHQVVKQQIEDKEEG